MAEKMSGNETEHHKVRIHIDREPYESPEHTNGEELYRLGKVPHGFKLFQEVHGDGEDRLVGRGGEGVAVHENEHFYSKKEVTIIVDGTPHEWPKEKISYAEVVTLEVPDYAKHPEITYSVKYKGAHGHKPEGILTPGASVKVKEGMIFNVSETGQS